ncbi:MAG: aminotransferase class V-fold PLP-dependent enzyme [Nitrospiraceae bacterium]|nr:aminotransferase class V-fold PLP-dependent enzyme [Nitrospiraceae bacterium]
MKRVYFDHNATTPVHPEVRKAMLPFLDEKFGNPSSPHWAGREVKKYVDEAREKVAALVNAEPSEIIFTGGGSEGDNMAIKGVLFKHLGRGGHVVTTAVEHPAVIETCRFMERIFGFGATYAPVDSHGMLDPDDIKKSIRRDTRLISVMAANNETGNIFPVKEIAAIAREREIPFHVDAVQVTGKIPVDVKGLGVDILTASGHKFNAPKGIGFQYVRKGFELLPFITGGHQERGMRAGTEDVAGIVGLGKACELAMNGMERKKAHIGRLRDRLEEAILARVPQTVLNGHKENRIYNTSNISFKYIEAEALLTMLDMQGIAVSTGSACSSETSEPSHVLQAMGLEPICSRGALRFSLGFGNSEDDIDYCMGAIVPIAERIQAMSPFFPR